MREEKMLIRESQFRGTVAHFRAVMEEISHKELLSWTAPSGQNLRVEEWRLDSTPDTRSTWYVWVPIPVEDVPRAEIEIGLHEIQQTHKADACIEAFELPTGHTAVYFWDRCSLSTLHCQPVDVPFEELCELVVQALEEEAAGQTAGSQLDLPPYVAKKPKTRAKHGRVYRLWLEMYKEYRDDFDFGGIKPRYEDLRIKSIEELGLEYSVRQLQDIIKAGKEGYLN